MDTKERKTSVQDTCPAPGSVCRTQSWRPAPPQAAKIELEKPESISRASENFFGIFLSVSSGLPLRSEALQPSLGLIEEARQPASFFNCRL
jgi:hypothetical protein